MRFSSQALNRLLLTSFTSHYLWGSLLFGLIFLGTAYSLSARSTGYALQAVTPIMESLISGGLTLRTTLIKQELLVLSVLLVLIPGFYVAPRLSRTSVKGSGLLMGALWLTVFAQYRLLHWDYIGGAVGHGIAGLLAYLYTIRQDRRVESASAYRKRPVLLALIAIVSYCTLFYRIDQWVPGQFRWSGQCLGDLLRYLSGDLHLSWQSLVWRRSLEAYCSECVYYILIMLAMLKSFGYRVLTFRLLSAGLGGINILLTFLFFKRFFSVRLGLLTASFMAVSSWHLLYARSETYAIFTITLPLATFLSLMIGLRERKPWALAGAGIGMGLMPSFYAVLRILPFFIVGYVVIREVLRTRWITLSNGMDPACPGSKTRFRTQLTWLLIPFSLFLAPQICHLDEVVPQYFGGRGEHVLHMTNQDQFTLNDKLLLMGEVMSRNVLIIVRNLLGFHESMFPIGYNKLMVCPLSGFLVIGFFCCLARIRQELYGFMILWLGFGTILAIGASHFTPARILVALSPVCFFTALGFEQVSTSWARISTRWSRAVGPLSLTLWGGLCVMELTNFYPRLGEQEQEAASQPYQACELIMDRLQVANIVMVFPTWDWAEEGFMRAYLHEWLQEQRSHKIMLYFMTADFAQLAADIRGGGFDRGPYLFVLESNPHETADQAREVLAAIRDRRPDLIPISYNNWAWLVEQNLILDQSNLARR